jgi:hypothetical protein
MQDAVRRPFGIDDGFVDCAGDERRLVQRAELAHPELGAVPRHARVIPGDPREPPAGRVDTRGHEEVVAGDEHDGLGRTVGRQRDELVVDLTVGVPLADADHGFSVRRDDSVGITQRVRLRRLRSDRLRLRTRAVHSIDAAVGEIGVKDGVAVVPDGAASVLVNAGSGVCTGRNQVDDLPAGTQFDNDGAASLVGSGLGPADSASADVDRGVAWAGGPCDQVGAERSRPRSVRAGRHDDFFSGSMGSCPAASRR